jgi:hypothetical protein
MICIVMLCFHCNREVRETTHTQKGYRVDYYLLHTGRGEWSFQKSPKEDMPALRYLKLTDPVDIISCTECHADPRIRKLLEDDFNGSGSILANEPEVGSEKAFVGLHHG